MFDESPAERAAENARPKYAVPIPGIDGAHFRLSFTELAELQKEVGVVGMFDVIDRVQAMDMAVIAAGCRLALKVDEPNHPKPSLERIDVLVIKDVLADAIWKRVTGKTYAQAAAEKDGVRILGEQPADSVKDTL